MYELSDEELFAVSGGIVVSPGNPVTTGRIVSRPIKVPKEKKPANGGGIIVEGPNPWMGSGPIPGISID